MKKYFILLFVVLGLSFLGWKVYQKSTAEQKHARPNRRSAIVAVEIAPIKKNVIQDVRHFTGSLYPASEIMVAPKIAGRIEKILVRIGDRVKNGQLIATIEDEEYRQQVIQAEADLEVARANLQEQRNPLENARKEHERIISLYEKRIVSESAFDKAVSELKTQEAKLNVSAAMVYQKEAALETAKVRLAYTQIQLAAENGNGYRVVGERFVDEGAMLSANTPIVSVLDIEKLIAVIHVIERDYPKIHPGMKATVFTDAFQDRVFTGEVIRIAPLLKETSREARVELEIMNHDRLLKPGMFIRARIQFDEHKNATVVPVSAIVKRNGAQGIFLADLIEKKARFVQVKVGIVNGNAAEVLEPAISGSVVVLGHHLLEDGGAILLPEQPPTGEDLTNKPRTKGQKS
jgi:RND family efflux transporter MFP subunit